MVTTAQEIWDIWVPGIAAQGLSFARGRLDATDTLLVHAAGAVRDVDVRRDDGTLVARTTGLARTAETPITRLRRERNTITREDIWPTDAEYGLPVLMAGGEVGILQAWWNDPERREWRWRVELYNHR